MPSIGTFIHSSENCLLYTSFLARITRKFEYIKYENDSNMLINAVDYMMPSILKSFHIDIIDNETYIATPIAIYIE